MTLSAYTAGQVLTAASLNTNFDSTLAIVKTQTIGTGVSSVTVTDAFSSKYENYLVILNSGVASTANDLRLTLGATATGYYYGAGGFFFSGPGYAVASANAAFILFGLGSTDSLSGMTTIMSPQLAKRTGFNNGSASKMSTTGEALYVNGYLNDATQYTAFTITTSTGTMTGGTIRVYGYANS